LNIRIEGTYAICKKDGYKVRPDMMFLHAETSHNGFGEYEAHYYYLGRILNEDEETRVEAWKHKQRQRRLRELEAEAKSISEVKSAVDPERNRQETFARFARQVQSFKALGKVLTHTSDGIIATKLGDIVQSLHDHLISTDSSEPEK